LFVAPTLPGPGDAATADGGNGVTIGRIASVIAEETGTLATLRSPGEIPKTAFDLRTFLESADISLVVVLHAFKCGDVLDALATSTFSESGRKVPTVLVLGGTDVNVDVSESAARAATLARRARAVNAVVAFSETMVAAASDVFRAPEIKGKITVVPQGVRLPETPSKFQSNGCDANRSGAPTLHSVLGVPERTPVFLLPAGLRPVKDVLWAADAAEAVARKMTARGSSASFSASASVSASSFISSSPREASPPFVFAVVGPVLDEAYASTVFERAGGSRLGGAGVFRYVPAAPRAVAVEYARAAACVVNTSHSEGQSGALLEAAAVGTPILARDVPGNRALLAALEAASGEEEFHETRSGVRREGTREEERPGRSSGFLFDSPEALAGFMGSFSMGSPEMVNAANRCARIARLGAAGVARRERESWREIVETLSAEK